MSNQIVDINTFNTRKRIKVLSDSVANLCEAVENLCDAMFQLNDVATDLETRIAALEDKLNEKV